MPPKKNTPPLDPEAVHFDFASQEAVLLEVINAEAKKLVDLRKAALSDLQAHTMVSKSTTLLMKAAIRALVLLFEVRGCLPSLFLFSNLLLELGLGAQGDRYP